MSRVYELHIIVAVIFIGMFNSKPLFLLSLLFCILFSYYYAVIRNKTTFNNVDRLQVYTYTISTIPGAEQKQEISTIRKQLREKSILDNRVISSTLIPPENSPDPVKEITTVKVEAPRPSLFLKAAASADTDYKRTLKHVNYGRPSFINPRSLDEPSFYHQTLGFYYSNMSLPMRATPQNRVIYTSHLVDDSERMGVTIENSLKGWRKRFEELKEEVYREFEK